MIGVAMLTPVILSPIGGTIIAVSFGEDKWRIFIYMLLSSILWSLILSVIFYYIKSIS
jgi:ABC-type sulfate transport system permease subunit